MKIPIESITVDNEHRIRGEVGDLESLQASIREVGLINPLLIDEGNKLIAGFRRLLACKNLGWSEIEVRVVSFGKDPLIELEAEVAENLYRKDFTPEEIMRIEKRRQEIIRLLRGNIFQRFRRWLVDLWKKIFRRQTPRS
jgi:ParB family chromosome partitioning protein